MGKTTTNFVVILGFITVAFAGYYLYTQQGSTVLDTGTNTQATQEMLRNAKVFIGYGVTLREVDLDIAFFEDERFRSLNAYTTPIIEQPVGRANPFSETAAFRSAPDSF